MSEPDPYHLQRFLVAQSNDYDPALRELQRGRKESHWIWYIFPQVAGLGRSSMAGKFAIKSRAEAVAFLNHPVLGARLDECCRALLTHSGKPVGEIMGFPDDLKLRSSMTLFAAVAKDEGVFRQVLDIFYSGEMDEKTMAFLDTHSGR